MAQFDCEDAPIRNIAKKSLDFLIENVGVDNIQSVLLTGSLANGEGTVIKSDNSLLESDFDIEVYLNFFKFIKLKNHILNISDQISKKLERGGVNTHVLFLPTRQSVAKLFGLTFSCFINLYSIE